MQKHKYRPFTTRDGSKACAECNGNEYAEQHQQASEPLRWRYFGKWEAFSPRFTANNTPLRWVICVCQDGKFDLNESDAGLCNGIAAFDTLAAAKAFCEGSEAAASAFVQDYDRGDGVFIDAVQSHRHDWKKSIDGGTYVCECGAFK